MKIIIKHNVKKGKNYLIMGVLPHYSFPHFPVFAHFRARNQKSYSSAWKFLSKLHFHEYNIEIVQETERICNLQHEGIKEVWRMHLLLLEQLQKNDKKYNVTKYTKIMIYVLICKGAFLKVEKWKEQLGNAALLKL